MDHFGQKASTLDPGEPVGSLVPCAPELVRPFEILEPRGLGGPVVFSSPHSGSVYPASFIAAAQLDPLTLRRSEDAFVDDLFLAAPELGAPLMRALFPRAFLDVNREPWELDPRMFDEALPPYANTRSMRVAGGLGTVARVVGEAKEIYARKLPLADAMARIASLYRPYHLALRHLLHRTWMQHGMAVLVDCHSMPSNIGRSDRIKADIILGDRFGTSCDARLVDAAESELRRLGYLVARNKPYAGGFITEHYGNPAAGWHAFQIEINRALYLNEETLERTAAFAELKLDLKDVMISVIEAATRPHDRSLAAE